MIGTEPINVVVLWPAGSRRFATAFGLKLGSLVPNLKATCLSLGTSLDSIPDADVYLLALESGSGISDEDYGAIRLIAKRFDPIVGVSGDALGIPFLRDKFGLFGIQVQESRHGHRVDQLENLIRHIGNIHAPASANSAKAPATDEFRDLYRSHPTLSYTLFHRQERSGATFALSLDRLAIRSTPLESDAAVFETALTRTLLAEIRRKSSLFKDFSNRIDNQYGWTGIRSLGERVNRSVLLPRGELLAHLGEIYSQSIEIASFVEMDGDVLNGASRDISPLDPDARRAILDLLRTLAPWLRRFPSIRELDDEASQMLIKQASLHPVQQVFSSANTAKWIPAEDAEALLALLAAARRGGEHGAKAKKRGLNSAKNLLVATAGILITVTSGAVGGAIGNELANRSLLIDKVAEFLATVGDKAYDVFAHLPDDIRIVLESYIKEYQAGAAIRPEEPLEELQDDPGDGSR
ncbi:MAG TPA: hypothetical protein VN029_13945 [Sphingomonas sp.]|nr:hypothetical protein [Sphingomonas sp.]